MDKIRLAIISAGILAVIMNIFESIYPSEKYAKQIRTIFALIFVICIARPLAKLPSESERISGSIEVMNGDIASASDNTLEYFKSSVERNISSEIMELLKQNNINAEEIKTSINISENGSISINEIKIAAGNAARGAEIIDIVKNQTGEDTLVIIEEQEYEKG